MATAGNNRPLKRELLFHTYETGKGMPKDKETHTDELRTI